MKLLISLPLEGKVLNEVKRMRCSGNSDYILQKPFATRTPSTTPWSPSLPEGGLDYTSPPSHKQTTFIRRGGVSPPVINTNRRKTAGADGFPNANTVSIWGSEQTPALRQKSNVHLYCQNGQIAVGDGASTSHYKHSPQTSPLQDKETPQPSLPPMQTLRLLR